MSCSGDLCYVKELSIKEINQDWLNEKIVFPLEKTFEKVENQHVKITLNEKMPKPNNDKSKWIDLEDALPEASYVNLNQNTESYTGYNGIDIWNQIYEENIMKIKSPKNVKESEILYKLISGIHSSINMHISQYHGTKYSTEVKKNHKQFVNTVGGNKERLENMYFAYEFVLTALSRAQKDIQSFDFSLYNSTENKIFHNMVNRFINQFDNSGFVPLKDNDLYKPIKKQNFVDLIHPVFLNITRLLNCVTCEKCKLHGKLQFNGLSAVMKIMFPEIGQGELTRNELVGLINLIRKLSNSITWYKSWIEYEMTSGIYLKFMFYIVLILLASLYLLAVVLIPGDSNEPTQVPKKEKSRNHYKDD